jgi:ABC-type lipoprotein release transport system permease subunit
VVRALGTPSRNVALTVVLEGLTLGIVSLAVGALVAFPLMVWWHNSPPDLGSIFGDFTMAGSLVRPILRVDYSTDGPVLSAIALLLTGVLAAAYPALRAVRIPPADALSGR